MSAFFRFDDDWYVVAQENFDDVIAVQFWHKRGGPSVPVGDYPKQYVPTVLVCREEELELA